MGYHKFKEKEKYELEAFLNYFEIIYLTQPTFEIAIELRQRRSLTLGDALIAATCIENKIDLMTRNIADFKWIKEINVINPFE